MVILRKRYRREGGKYVLDEKGRWLLMRAPFGYYGYLDLTVETPLGFPVNPETGVPYIEEGLSPDKEV